MTRFLVGDIVAVTTTSHGSGEGTVTDVYRTRGGDAYTVSPNPPDDPENLWLGVTRTQLRLIVRFGLGDRVEVAEDGASGTIRSLDREPPTFLVSLDSGGQQHVRPAEMRLLAAAAQGGAR